MNGDGFWLAGLVDGEGTFALQVKRRGPERRYKRVEFSFKISLRADDLPTLVEAQRILDGIGHICRCGKEGRDAGNGYKGHALYMWFVNKKDEVAQVIACFRQYPLRSKKRADFEMWAEAFEVLARHIRHTSRSPKASRRGLRYRYRLAPKGKSMPLFTEPRKQFREIPEDVFGLMEEYAHRLKAVRAYTGAT